MSRKIETAVGLHIVGHCPLCNDLHLYFTDADGNQFAEAVLDDALVLQLLRGLRCAFDGETAGQRMQ